MNDDCCSRCQRSHTPFRVQTVGRWVPVCAECIEPGDIVYADLPNGQLVGDVAEEINQ